MIYLRPGVLLYYNSKDITMSSVYLESDVGEPGVAEVFIPIGLGRHFLLVVF